MLYQFLVLPVEVQVVPEFVEVQMFLPLLTAASFVPSLEEVMLCQISSMPSTEVSSVQSVPEFVEVQIFPPQTTAASLVPSLEEVMLYQALWLPTEVTSVQVVPELVEVQIFP